MNKMDEITYGIDIQGLSDLEKSRYILFSEEEYLRQFFHWINADDISSFCDFCCGSGFLAIKICQNFDVKGIGIDREEKFIKYATNKSNELGLYNRLSFKISDVSKLISLEENSFDVCYSFAGLQIVKNYQDALLEMKRLTKKDGSIILFLPIDECPQSNNYEEGNTYFKEIQILENELFPSYYKKLELYKNKNKGIHWKSAPKIMEKIGLKNIKLFGMFMPFSPENLNKNDFIEYLNHEYNLLTNFAYSLYKRYCKDIKIYKDKLNRLVDLYGKGEKRRIRIFKQNKKLFNWKGAPLLII
ncbi:MAG: class I SAM-dependent methyltransferase, partial [Candidatus Helarchaeota archaeon]